MVYRGATLLIIIAIAASLGSYTLAQTKLAQLPMFEDVRLNPKFSPDPLIVKGISGGSVAAKTVAGRDEAANSLCVGFINSKPDHTIVLEVFFDYLSLQVQSPEDTTLVVHGPGGSWCNDDYQGKNPGIAGQWLAGTYSIWVGSYYQTQYHPYLLRITKSRVDLNN